MQSIPEGNDDDTEADGERPDLAHEPRKIDDGYETEEEDLDDRIEEPGSNLSNQYAALLQDDRTFLYPSVVFVSRQSGVIRFSMKERQPGALPYNLDCLCIGIGRGTQKEMPVKEETTET